MRILYSAVFVTLITLIFSCQKEISHGFPDDGDYPPNPSSPFRGTIQGNIVDENGKAAVGVTVKAGEKTTVTDARGYFRIREAQLYKEAAMVSAEKTGYFKAFRTFNATSGVNQVKIKLIPKKLSGTISSASGGSVNLTNGTVVSLQANGVMKATGSAYTGTVNVYSVYIDPTSNDIASIIPGGLLAHDKDNKQVVLTSYGMIAVELESTGGEKLQIASGKTATLTMPIPASLEGAAPTTIPLWYVEESTGLWREEGSATKSGNNYVGEVKHFTYWNCDVPGPRVNVTATFLAPQGVPLVHAEIYIRPVGSGGGTAHGFTDSLGQISGPVPANTPLVLEIFDPCRNVLFSRNIGPFTADANIGTINLTSSSSNGLVTIKGKLLKCNNTAVTDGYAIIYYDNTVRYANVNNSGEFVSSFTRCSTSPVTAEILGVDKGGSQQGPSINATISNSLNDLGTISACGTSTLEYVNYTIDGSSYSVTNQTPSDSLNSFPGNAGINRVMINADGAGTNGISFYFDHNNSAGVFDLGALTLQTYVVGSINLVRPFTVTLTNCPLASGQFYEGNFAGQFTTLQAPTVIHNISCSFRVRRMF